MDTPTQALLGAAIGQAFFSRKLGRRAMLWGAVAGALPDLDLFPAELLSPWGEFLYHRGPTHSLFFALLGAPVFGFLVWKGYARWKPRPGEFPRTSAGQPQSCRRLQPGADSLPQPPWPSAGSLPVATGQAPKSGSNMPEPRLPDPGGPGFFLPWTGLFFLALFTHPLLDLFTSYGTQLLWPLSRHRFALQGVAIIDPFYSLTLAAALLTWRLSPPARKIVRGRLAALAALGISTVYLFFGLWLGFGAEAEVRRQLAAEGIGQARVQCYPTLLQPFLRRVVARTGSEIRVGLFTMWKPSAVPWRKFEVVGDPRVEHLLDTEEGKIFHWFAMGEISARVVPLDSGYRVEIDDLRYGFYGPPEFGLWGIAAVFDAGGKVIGEVERFRRPYPPVRETLVRLWRETFGLSSACS